MPSLFHNQCTTNQVSQNTPHYGIYVQLILMSNGDRLTAAAADKPGTVWLSTNASSFKCHQTTNGRAWRKSVWLLLLLDVSRRKVIVIVVVNPKCCLTRCWRGETVERRVFENLKPFCNIVLIGHSSFWAMWLKMWALFKRDIIHAPSSPRDGFVVLGFVFVYYEPAMYWSDWTKAWGVWGCFY